MVKERKKLSASLTEEDITLKEIIDKCPIIDTMCYVGNLSNLFFYPILKPVFDNISPGFDIYAANIWLYCTDDFLIYPNCIYATMSKETAFTTVPHKGTIFQVLSNHCATWYFDGETVVMVFAVPIKLLDDYKRIIKGDFVQLSSAYTNILSKTGLIRAILTHNDVIIENWNNLHALLFDEKDYTAERMVTETRLCPTFIKEKETYYAREKEKNSKERY